MFMFEGAGLSFPRMSSYQKTLNYGSLDTGLAAVFYISYFYEMFSFMQLKVMAGGFSKEPGFLILIFF